MLEINGEAVSGKTDDAISTIVKDVEESNGSLELLVRRGTPATSRTQLHKEQKPSTSKRKPHALERLSSWYRSWRSPNVQVATCSNIIFTVQIFGVQIVGTKSKFQLFKN